jgi:UDP-N-acetylmuramate dehydrogenase
MIMTLPAAPVEVLSAAFGAQVKENVSLAPYTSARIGGPADILLTAASADDLAAMLRVIWEHDFPCFILGGGSNVLVGDKGVRGVTILNRAKAVAFEKGEAPRVRAESGVVFSNLANRCAAKGYAGLEWAATVPGTIGGAVYGNAGAFGGEVAGNLLEAEVLSESGRATWPLEKLGYGYRTSALKRGGPRAVVLAATLMLKNASRAAVTVKIAEFSDRRKSTQPPGASMGSMFKNPENDFAGRLIEAAGLKGTRIGNAEISPLHGNFFVNHGRTRAGDVRALIDLARRSVQQKFGVELELEIELVGEW